MLRRSRSTTGDAVDLVEQIRGGERGDAVSLEGVDEAGAMAGVGFDVDAVLGVVGREVRLIAAFDGAAVDRVD